MNLDINIFQTGDDLVSSMEKAVRESAIFVYFASRASMSSTWVKYELNEARYYQAASRIRKFIVILLDDRLSPNDFPDWMSRSVFLKSRAPGPIARAIRSAIDSLVQDQQANLFVGRARETAALLAAFVPPGTTESISLVCLRGLPGIGRRTLLARTVPTLGISSIITLRVEPGDNQTSLAIKLADLIEPGATADETLATAQEIQKLSADTAGARFVADLENAFQNNELIVLYDDGGLLDSEGAPSSAMAELLSEIHKHSGILTAVVTNRRPYWQDDSELINTPVVDVGPLQRNEVTQLVGIAARARGISLTAEDIAALVEQIRGYPPAATAAIKLVETYGVKVTVGLKTQSPEYQPRPLTRYLKSLQLGSAERKLLRILSSNSPLPIELLTTFVPSEDDALRALADLIDASLVIPQQGSSWYRISDPIIDYVERDYPPCSVAEYAQVAEELEQFLASDTESGPYLDLSRVFYRALVHAGHQQQQRAFALASDWLRLAEDFYHKRLYERALEFATIADENGYEREALPWIIRARVKLGDSSGALLAIDRLRRTGEIKEAHFLRGFLERHRSRHAEAIKYYELARQAGRGGLALERDLAECYVHVGDLDRASQHIAAAQQRQPDNPYVVSLRIKIACRRRDEATARSLLPLLDVVDNPVFAQHRRSRVELVFGDPETAYSYAKAAVNSSDRPPVEAMSNLALCEILTNRFDDARRMIERIRQLYHNQRHDVQIGLQARLAISEQRFEDALGYCEKFENGDDPIHMALKIDAIRGLLDHTNMPASKRADFERTVTALESQLRARYGRTDWEVEPD